MPHRRATERHRPGYTSGVGATRDLQRVVVYSVNTTHMGQELPATVDRIIRAAFPAAAPPR
jgi:D-alanyl-D-alanine carboxypeptidase